MPRNYDLLVGCLPQIPREIVFTCLLQIGRAERRTPSARATFSTVSNRGFAPGDNAL